VKSEDYSKAKRCKNEIEALKEIDLRISDCEIQKEKAVAEEDYDLAKRFKMEIDAMLQRTLERHSLESYEAVGE